MESLDSPGTGRSLLHLAWSCQQPPYLHLRNDLCPSRMWCNLRDNSFHFPAITGCDTGDDGCGWKLWVGPDPAVVLHELKLLNCKRDYTDGSDDNGAWSLQAAPRSLMKSTTMGRSGMRRRSRKGCVRAAPTSPCTNPTQFTTGTCLEYRRLIMMMIINLA